MANKQFGETLRELRNLVGYTQQQVSDILGLKNKSTLGSWEVGKSEPDGYTLLKLCKIYEVEDIYHAFGEISLKSTKASDILEENDYTNHEKKIITKYRALTAEGKNTVDLILDNQYEQVQPKIKDAAM